MRYLFFIGLLLLAHCTRGMAPTPLAEDKSIVFPDFLGKASISLRDQGTLYELDGVTLQALMVATHDFLPTASKEQPCWRKPDGHRYLIIRQGDIIFIQIYADIFTCKQDYMLMDHGVKYAISTDGRILRRIFAGDPDDSPPPEAPAPWDGGVPQERDYSDVLGATTLGSQPVAIPLNWLDAGSSHPTPPARPAPDGGSLPDAGLSPDGGLPRQATGAAPR